MRTIAWLIGTLMCLGIQAEPLAPDVLVQEVVHDVQEVLRAGDQEKIPELVDTRVLPHFNFERMTKLAVGKSWRTATPEQKQALQKEFRTLLVRTYTKALTAYRDQRVKVHPVKLEASATEATVRTEIVKSGGQQPLLVDYDLEKTQEGWKVYDLTVGGVSLVTSYRSAFADQIQQAGVDGLIRMLTEKNQTAARAAAQQAEIK